MNLIFDSHAHYDDKTFNSDRDSLLKKLIVNDICGLINVGADLKTSQASIDLSEKYPFIWAAVGVHPNEADNLPCNYIDVLKSMLKKDKVVAIGEIGLDYHYEQPSKEIQKQVFENQLKLAIENSMPVIIHDRDAHGDTLELLKKYKPKGVVHCFSGSPEMADEIVKLGMYIGLGGVVTFKNAKNPVLVAQKIPLDKLLLETDCPYMAPVPLRGNRCDSSMIRYTAKKIADLKGIEVRDLLSITKNNTEKLFSIKM